MIAYCLPLLLAFSDKFMFYLKKNKREKCSKKRDFMLNAIHEVFLNYLTSTNALD